MGNLFSIRVDIPSLDRFVNFLESQQQAQIDALTAQVGQLTERLHSSSTVLKSAVDQDKK